VRAIVVHGHFYQPPREDPWLEYVEAESNAAPYHDWNQRIERECYRAVTAARLPGRGGRIARIENTLAWTSFDFGPTLLDWMEREVPETYADVLEADRAGRDRLGHGNAVAAPYHHVILPLASRREKVAEVRWGSADFRRRFGRAPEGMWLPETAVDDETLDVLAQHDIAFTILAPHQVDRPPARGLPGCYRTGGGREIALFVYDGPLSHDVAFGAAIDDGVAWAHRMLAGAGAEPSVAAVATDGETYGHHHRFGEMALARMLAEVRRAPAAELTNFAAVLARHGAAQRLGIVAPSSWSCVHGVGRWRTDCGCRVAPERGWHQRWRAPLREAVEWLAGELHEFFEREAAGLLADPWAARDAYAESFGALGEPDPGFVRAQALRALSDAEAVRAGELLELERNALRLFTSCAWFFDDVGGLEQLQVLRYAARAMELAGPQGTRLETGFVSRLAGAVSNDPAFGDARRMYLERARPRVPAPARVAGSYAAVRLVAPHRVSDRAYCYDVSDDGGRVELTHRRTGRAAAFDVSVRRSGGARLSVTVAPVAGADSATLEIGDLLERERETVVAALTVDVLARAQAPDAAERLGSGAATLAETAEQSLLRAVLALAHDRSPETLAAAFDLLDLFELHGWAVPFDVQTAFYRRRSSLPAEEARALEPLALRLGFAAADED
jgi:hypothetical protein